MSLFASVTKNLVEAVGSSGSIHPTVDLLSAEYFKPIYLIILKTSIWPWRKPQFIPTQMKVDDILFEPTGLSKKMGTEAFVINLIDDPTFKTSGGLSLGFTSCLTMKLSANNEHSVNVNIPQISKDFVPVQDAIQALLSSRVKLDHPLLSNMQKNRHASLCIVLESINCATNGTVSMTRKIGGQASLSEAVTQGTISTIAEKDTDESFVLPSGTVLAFTCHRLSVSQDGHLNVHISYDADDSLTSIISDAKVMPKQDSTGEAPLFSSDWTDFKTVKLSPDLIGQQLDGFFSHIRQSDELRSCVVLLMNNESCLSLVLDMVSALLKSLRTPGALASCEIIKPDSQDELAVLVRTLMALGATNTVDGERGIISVSCIKENARLLFEMFGVLEATAALPHHVRAILESLSLEKHYQLKQLLTSSVSQKLPLSELMNRQEVSGELTDLLRSLGVTTVTDTGPNVTDLPPYLDSNTEEIVRDVLVVLHSLS